MSDDSHRLEFLERLLDAPGPSGFEVRPARVWREEAESVADAVETDVTGNSMAILNRDGRPRVMLAGHIDEIGLQVTHIDDDGFLFIDEIGGWDPQVLVGQRVTLLGREGDVPGVVGKKPIHLLKPEERKQAAETEKLWVDVGAGSRDEVRDLGLRVGDPLVVSAGMVRLAGDRIASRAVDNRIGAYVVLEALRRVAEDPGPGEAAVFAVATAQEEIGRMGGGAASSAFSLEPDVALVVDVTFSTRGSAAHPVVFARLVEVAEAEGIEHTIQASPSSTRTDADGIHLTRGGVPTGLISVPNRYMHSPNEIVSTGDLDRTARLLAAFIRGLGPDTDFTPR